MIDWANLAGNALWILGLSLALATLSYSSWQASITREKFFTSLSHPGPQASLDVAGALFCAGLAATSAVLWQKALWAVLGIIFLVQVFLPHKNA